MGHERKAGFLGGPRDDSGEGAVAGFGRADHGWECIGGGLLGRRDTSGDLGMTTGARVVWCRIGVGDGARQEGGIPRGTSE